LTNLFIFIEILVNGLSFISLTIMISIIFYTREPSTQENFCFVLYFYVSRDVNFSHFAELKSNLSHRFILFYELCTKEIRKFGGQ